MKPMLLNLGCGTFINEDWVNVDFSSSNDKVVVCDLSRGVPFLTDTFDAVYHSHLLEHFHKRDAISFLKECFRVLKPGGILRIVVPDLEGICEEYLKRLKAAENGAQGTSCDHEWITIEMLDQLVRERPGGEMADYLLNDMPNRDYVEHRIGTDVIDRVAENSKVPERKMKRCVKFLLRAMFGKHFDHYMAGRFRNCGEVHKWMYDKVSLTRLLSACGFSGIAQKSAVESNIPDFMSYGLDLYKGEKRGCSSLFMEAVKPLH
jgi:predicted SAM-dependent methyltransferase